MSDIRGYDVHYINKLEADIEQLRASEAYMASKLEQTLVIEGELRQRIAELESALREIHKWYYGDTIANGGLGLNKIIDKALKEELDTVSNDILYDNADELAQALKEG